MTNVLLPLDTIRHIIEYSNDIDVRRSFGIYGKLDPSYYAIEPRGLIRSLIEYGKNNKAQIEIIRYNMYNIHDLPQRTRYNIMYDAMQVSIRYLPNNLGMMYEIDMYKLKRRTFEIENRSRETECDFPLGSLRNEYYWDAFLYSYTRP